MTVMRRGFRREIDALAEVFPFLESFVIAAGIGEATAFTVNLVAEELFTNMVRHADGGGERIEITAECIDDELRLTLVDDDVDPFDPESVPIPRVNAGIDQRREGGLGLFLVRNMVDDLEYDYEPASRRMRVSVSKRLES